MSNDVRLRARLLHFVTGALALVLLSVATAKAADEDLPGRVGRVADYAGELFFAPEDRATDWTAVGLNQPITTGDNLWVNGSGRAEIDYGGGQFRLAGDTNLHVSRLDDRELALFVANGGVIVRVRVLDSGDAVSVDTPNTQLQLNRTGLYRIDVDPDRETTTLLVREGEATVSLAGGVQHAWPGQSVSVTGMGASYADVRSGAGVDGFDTWSANRDRHYERARSTAYVSRQMVGYADLDSYGSWETSATYGPVWYPTAVVDDWAPYRFGHWTWISGFGYAWVDDAPWGYAPFHYGRWVYVGNRWGWCPGHYVARPVWAPALVGWYGGSGWSVSVNVGAPVYGWVPLAWGEPYHPWWGRCSNACWHRYNRPYAVNVVERPHRPPSTYVNVRVPGAITAVAGTTLAAAKPVAANRIAVRAGSPPPALTAAPPIRPLPVAVPAVRAGTGGAPAPASTLYQPKPRMTPAPAYSAPARDASPAVRSAPTAAAPSRAVPVTAQPSAAAPAAPVTTLPRAADPQRQVSQGAPLVPPTASQPMTAPQAPRVDAKPRHTPRQEGIAVPAPAPAAPTRAVAPPPVSYAPVPAPRAVAPAAPPSLAPRALAPAAPPPAPRAVAPAAPPAPNAGASPQAPTRGQGQPAAAPHEKPSANPGGGPREAAR